MSSGANYQHSGIENLRGNETIEHVPIISGTAAAKNVIPSTVQQRSGTENIRGNERDMHVPIITGSANGQTRTPASVRNYKDATV